MMGRRIGNRRKQRREQEEAEAKAHAEWHAKFQTERREKERADDKAIASVMDDKRALTKRLSSLGFPCALASYSTIVIETETLRKLVKRLER